MGTVRWEIGVFCYLSPLDFQGSSKAHRTSQNKEMLCRPSSPFSGQSDSRAIHFLKMLFFSRQKEKRTLPRAFADVSRFACVTTLPTLCEGVAFSSSWSRNFDLVPFRSCAHFKLLQRRKTLKKIVAPRLEERKLPHVLGPTDPCPTAVHMEPFSTSVFKDLIWIFATTTKICTRVRSSHPHG